MFWIISGIIIGLLLLVISLLSENREEFIPEISVRTYLILQCTVFFAFAFLLFYKADEIPIPFHVDEAGVAYDGLSISNHHRERFGYVFPVYFSSGLNALYPYLAAVSIRLMGYCVMSVRLPAIVLSLISVIIFSLLLRDAFGNTVSVVGTAVFCFLPFSIMHSRWALESYLLFPMLIISCGVFYHAVKCGRSGWFILAGLCFGVTLYSYAVSYMILPLFLGSMTVYLIRARRLRWKKALLFWVPLAVLAFPLLLMLAVNNGVLDEITTGFISVPKLVFYRGNEVSLKNAAENLRFGPTNFFYRIFVRDDLIYNVIPKFGTMYYFSLPFVLYGFFLCLKDGAAAVKQREFTLNVLMLFLTFCVFVVLLVLPYTNVNRACALFFPLIYYLVTGLCAVFRKYAPAAPVLGGLFFLSALGFVCYYFAEFPRDVSYELSFTSVSDLEEALAFAEGMTDNDEVITIYGLSQPYLYTLLAKHIDPYAFNEQMTLNGSEVTSIGRYHFQVGEVSPDQVYLLRTHGWVPEEIRQQAFNLREFGTVTVYYP